MAMIGQKDKPTYYNIVGKTSGAVVATASGSRVLKVRKQLQKDYNEELIIVAQE